MTCHAVGDDAVGEGTFEIGIEGDVGGAVRFLWGFHAVGHGHQVVPPDTSYFVRSVGGKRAVGRPVMPPVRRPDPLGDFPGRHVEAEKDGVVSFPNLTFKPILELIVDGVVDLLSIASGQSEAEKTFEGDDSAPWPTNDLTCVCWVVEPDCISRVIIRNIPPRRINGNDSLERGVAVTILGRIQGMAIPDRKRC